MVSIGDDKHGLGGLELTKLEGAGATPTTVSPIDISERFGAHGADAREERSLMPGQKISSLVRAEIATRVARIAPDDVNARIDQSDLLAELNATLDLNPSDVITESLKANVMTGVALGLSLFNGDTPGASMRDVLSQQHGQAPGNELDTLNVAELRIFLNEIREIIAENKPLASYIDGIIERGRGGELTRFESAFARGMIAGAIPTYVLCGTRDALDEQLGKHELQLISNMRSNAEIEPVVPTNLVLEAFATPYQASSGTLILGSEGIKKTILSAKYYELFREQKSKYDRDIASTAKSHLQWQERDGMGSSVLRGFFGGIGFGMLATITSLVYSFPFSSQFLDKLDRGEAFLSFISTAILGSVIGFIRAEVGSRLRQKKANPFLSDLKRQIDEYKKHLGDDDSKWIREGVRLQCLDPELFKVKRFPFNWGSDEDFG